jgi:glycogen operon protein
MKDLTWINVDGTEMTDEAWTTNGHEILGLMLCGDAMNLFDYKGEVVTDGTYLLFFNAHYEDVEIGLPGNPNVRWRLLLDTKEETGWVDQGVIETGGGSRIMIARSFNLFEQQGGTVEEARDVRGRRMLRDSRPPSQPPPKSGPGETR